MRMKLPPRLELKVQMAVTSLRDAMDKPFLVWEIEMAYFIKTRYNRALRQYKDNPGDCIVGEAYRLIRGDKNV